MSDQKQKMFVHSKCCGAHWELCYEGGTWTLECERCGQSPGSGLEVVGPTLDECTCASCGCSEVPPTKH